MFMLDRYHVLSAHSEKAISAVLSCATILQFMSSSEDVRRSVHNHPQKLKDVATMCKAIATHSGILNLAAPLFTSFPELREVFPEQTDASNDGSNCDEYEDDDYEEEENEDHEGKNGNEDHSEATEESRQVGKATDSVEERFEGAVQRPITAGGPDDMRQFSVTGLLVNEANERPLSKKDKARVKVLMDEQIQDFVDEIRSISRNMSVLATLDSPNDQLEIRLN